MKNLKVCRFCLATDNSLTCINDKITAKNFVTVVGYSATEYDGLPQYLCAFCCYLVTKFALFRRRCDIAQTVFENAALEGRKVTTPYIKSLDRKSLGLSLPLQKSDIKIVEVEESDIDIKEVFFMPVDKVDLPISPHIIENDDDIDYKDLIVTVKEEKHESLGETKTDNEECAYIDLKVEVYSHDDKDELAALTVKEESKTKESIIELKCVEKNKKEIVGKKKTKNKTKLIDTDKGDRNARVAKKGGKVPYVFKQDFAVVNILSRADQLKDVQERAYSDNYINSQFKCDKCYRGFADMNAFSKHMLKHDVTSGDHMCDICKLRYRTSKQLRNHVINAHERKFACKQCNHISNCFHHAQLHNKDHNNITYKCQHCDATFRKQSTYFSHVRMKHASDHVCNICGASFIGPKGLKAHKLRSHKGNEETLSSKPKKNYCEECDIEFKTTEALERHTSTSSKHNSGSVCSLCCVSCGESFETNVTLLAHSQCHVDKLVLCQECGQQFTTARKCYTHYRSVHLGLKIVCEVCGKDFASNALLQQHQRTHMKSYRCKVCDRRFKDSVRLQVHSKSHSDEKPYSCPRCAKEYRLRRSFNRHIMKSHCKTSRRRKENENESPILNCDVCNKQFTLKCNLLRHIRLHTGPRLYYCEVCCKGYNAKCNLENHVKHLHMGVPYPKRIRIRRQ